MKWKRGQEPSEVLARLAFLLQQRKHKLLRLVRLGKSGDAGLLQDGVLGEIGHRRRNIRRPNASFGAGQVLDLAVDDIAGALQTMDAGADPAALCSDVLNGRIDGRKRGLRIL